MGRSVGHLKIMLSTRVLLNLEEADNIFKEAYEAEYAQSNKKSKAHDAAVEAYTAYVCPNEGEEGYDPEVGGRRFDKGPLFQLAEALNALNKDRENPIVELIFSAKDENITGDVIFRNIDLHSSAELRTATTIRFATAGEDLKKRHHDYYKTDALFTRNPKDAQAATDLGVAATTIHVPADGYKYNDKSKSQIHFCFDGDAVAFGCQSEKFFREKMAEHPGDIEKALEAYSDEEFKNFAEGMDPGPFTEFLRKISALNETFSRRDKPFKLSLITARGNTAHTRALAILKKLGIVLNGESHGRAGGSKADILKFMRPDIFIDDQFTHLNESGAHCPVGLVHYPKGSYMYDHLQKVGATSEADKMRKAEKPGTSGDFDRAAGGKEKPEALAGVITLKSPDPTPK